MYKEINDLIPHSALNEGSITGVIQDTIIAHIRSTLWLVRGVAGRQTKAGWQAGRRMCETKNCVAFLLYAQLYSRDHPLTGLHKAHFQNGEGG